MEEIKDSEINETIAEFMGYWDSVSDHPDMHPEEFLALPDYTTSLDALIPVWEKLLVNRIEVARSIDAYFCSIDNSLYYKEEQQTTIQKSAAIATYKAIKELQNRDK